MGKRIDYPGSQGYEKTYDCIVDTVGELTTDPDLVALDPYSLAIVLNTDQGADAPATIHVKLSTGSWKQI